ncbi:hypothetical protein LX32DRAFT_126603 [Colletotrichum zoysiae]|uniref:Uncharacterized protein n=1 Tax=Colletotrichum zoysiae TaxID=1216348 RepID=A0AAD9H7C3_9PEZI|nr:hypothetical protein LX32DRAFT_126603 [Colletotrichum zoysiae]
MAGTYASTACAETALRSSSWLILIGRGLSTNQPCRPLPLARGLTDSWWASTCLQVRALPPFDLGWGASSADGALKPGLFGTTSRSGNCLAFPFPRFAGIAWHARIGRYILQRISVRTTAARLQTITVQYFEFHHPSMQKPVHATLAAKNRRRAEIN